MGALCDCVLCPETDLGRRGQPSGKLSHFLHGANGWRGWKGSQKAMKHWLRIRAAIRSLGKQTRRRLPLKVWQPMWIGRPQIIRAHKGYAASCAFEIKQGVVIAGEERDGQIRFWEFAGQG